MVILNWADQKKWLFWIGEHFCLLRAFAGLLCQIFKHICIYFHNDSFVPLDVNMLDWMVLTFNPVLVLLEDLYLVKVFVGQGRSKSNPVCTSILYIIYSHSFLLNVGSDWSCNCCSFTFLVKDVCLIFSLFLK